MSVPNGDFDYQALAANNCYIPNSGTQLTGYWPDTTSLPYDPPRECSGDVHVFPCPHCATCKCGKATLHRGKK